MGEVIYQASAKNSRQRELLIQDTPQDINIKDIIALEVFLGCPRRVLSLKLENFPLIVVKFLRSFDANRDLDRGSFSFPIVASGKPLCCGETAFSLTLL